MATMQLTQHDNVYVLTLTNGDNDNTLSHEVLAEYEAAFDTVEAAAGPTALVITADHPKTFCTGIDLPWLQAQGPAGFQPFIDHLDRVLIRLSLLNAPVVMAINGNCYAGGALLAACADFRLMRADRGRLCYPEVKIKLPFTPVMLDIVRQLPNSHAVWELSMTGAAWGGEECAAKQVVDRALPAEALLPAALQTAVQLAQLDRATYATIKQGLRPAMVAQARARKLI